jgi:hypothetical protein
MTYLATTDTDIRPFAEALPSPEVALGAPQQGDLALAPESAEVGLPADRAARIAARRAFVEMKQIFMRAVAPLTDRKGEWLKLQVRQANEPLDLWLLRGPVLAALRCKDDTARTLRADLYRGLDSLFPDACTSGAPSTQAPVPEPWMIPNPAAHPGSAQHAHAWR